MKIKKWSLRIRIIIPNMGLSHQENSGGNRIPTVFCLIWY